MIRLVFILIVAALVGLGAAWLADHDGLLTLTIAGYEIRTSAAFATVLLLLLVIALVLLMQLAFFILGGPARLTNYLTHRRARTAYHALSRGLVAAAEGDAPECTQAARHAEKLLGSQPLTLLLRAQTAELCADEQRQESAYRAMLAHPETEFLGLRGLFLLAMRRRNEEQALSFAIRAHKLKPKAPKAADALFELRTARREWAEAEALLNDAVQTKTLSPERERFWRAALLTKTSTEPAAAELSDRARDAAPQSFTA